MTKTTNSQTATTVGDALTTHAREEVIKSITTMLHDGDTLLSLDKSPNGTTNIAAHNKKTKQTFVFVDNPIPKLKLARGSATDPLSKPAANAAIKRARRQLEG